MVALDEAARKAGISSQLSHDFELAKHALVYWIDEILINSPWSHAMEWRQHILEWDIYQERLRADRFFEKAHEAEVLANTDPLETYYLCVALGFRGKYVESQPELRAGRSGSITGSPRAASSPKSSCPMSRSIANL